MSCHGDGAWGDPPEGVDDAEPFEERDEEPIGSERRGLLNAAAIASGDACAGCGAYPAACFCVEPRGTIETPEPVCSVCGKAIELDPTCDNSEGPLYCEPCHDKVYP